MGYPNILPPPPSEIKIAIDTFVERQQYNYVYDPLRAHSDSLALAVVAGSALGAVRGALSAALSPPGNRLQIFTRATKAASFIYGTPPFTTALHPNDNLNRLELLHLKKDSEFPFRFSPVN